jgi:hypothetical protein
VFVCGLDRLGDLLRDGQGLVRRQWPGGDSRGQRRPVHELHDEGGDRIAARLRGHFQDTVDLRDVGMVERGQHLRFAVEARQPIGIVCDGGVKQLDGDVAIQLRIAGAMDLAHASPAEETQNLVVPETGTWCQRHQRPAIVGGDSIVNEAPPQDRRRSERRGMLTPGLKPRRSVQRQKPRRSERLPSGIETKIVSAPGSGLEHPQWTSLNPASPNGACGCAPSASTTSRR